MNLPTKITIARIILIPFFVAAYMIDFPFHNLVATGIFIVASLTDWLDGYIARKYNMVTTIGKFLDPIADKVLVSSALILASTIENVFQIYIIIATIIIIARELVVTCFRTIAASKNVVLAADKIGKAKTATQLVGLSFYLAYPAFELISALASEIILIIGFSFLMIATLLTIVSACNYIIRNAGVFKDEKIEEEAVKKSE